MVLLGATRTITIMGCKRANNLLQGNECSKSRLIIQPIKEDVGWYTSSSINDKLFLWCLEQDPMGFWVKRLCTKISLLFLQC